MKLYKVIQTIPMTEELSTNKHFLLEEAIKEYSKMKRKCKTHRSALDKNIQDIRMIEKSCQSINQSNNKRDIKKEVICELLKKMETL